MCEFVSWKEYDGHVYFLTDRDLETKAGAKLLLSEVYDDLCGHGAIEAFWPELKNKGKNCECVDFSSPKNFPKEIAAAIKKGKLFRIGRSGKLLTKKGKKAWQEAKVQTYKAYQADMAQAYKVYQVDKAWYEATAQAFLRVFKRHKIAAWR